MLLRFAVSPSLKAMLDWDREGLVAVARLLLVLSLLSADHYNEDNSYDPWSSVIFIGYFGVTLAGLSSFYARFPTKARYALHLADIGFTASLALTPDGPVPVFIMFTTFCLLAAAFRFGWAMVAVSGALLAGAFGAGLTLDYVPYERLSIRAAYILLAPVALSVATWNIDRMRQRVLKLARWTNGRFSDERGAALRVFRHAAEVLEAETVIVFWRELDDQRCWTSVYRTGFDTLSTEPTEIWPEDTIAPELRQASFIASGARCLTYAGVRRVADPVARKSALANLRGVIASAPFEGDYCDGRLFAAGAGQFRLDQLMLVEIVGAHVRSRIEGRSLRQRGARASAALERAQLSRDLHDGILQSLTATRLQLNAALLEAPPDTRAKIAAASNILREEQRRLREFVDESRDLRDIERPLSDLRDRIVVVAEHWGLAAQVEFAPKDAMIPVWLYREMSYLVAEAIANAARHSRPREVVAWMELDAERLQLLLGGSGVTIDNERLTRLPRSISERVGALGGSVGLAPGAAGVTLHVKVPTARDWEKLAATSPL